MQRKSLQIFGQLKVLGYNLCIVTGATRFISSDMHFLCSDTHVNVGWMEIYLATMKGYNVWMPSQTNNFLYCQGTKFYQGILFQNSCIFELINDTPGDLWQLNVL